MQMVVTLECPCCKQVTKLMRQEWKAQRNGDREASIELPSGQLLKIVLIHPKGIPAHIVEL